MQIQIQEVNIENVRNGKNSYDKATVNYLAGGQVREQKIMSFSNPAVFALVRGLKPGTTVDVEITKNDKGYNQWAKVELVAAPGAEVPKTASSPTAGKSSASWETAEERAKKQVLIVKQSSLSAAVALATDNGGQHLVYGGKKASIEDILSAAQAMTDWVFDDKVDLFKQPNDNLEDVPY